MPTGNNPEEAPSAPNSGGASSRILFVATSGGEGGIERYSVRLAEMLRVRGVSVTYAVRPDGFLEAHSASHNIPTVAWTVRNSGDLRAAVSLAHILREQSIDIVHVHSRRDYVPAILGAKLARRRVLLHAHLIRALGEPPPLAGRFFRWGSRGVIAVSEAVRERLREAHGLGPDFVHLLPNGVDTAAFVALESATGRARRAAQRQAWDVPQDALVVGMLGRLNAKGQEKLLAAGPALMAEFPDLWFVLAGPEGGAGDRENLTAQAGDLGIAERVVLPGLTEDVPAAMAGFDILAHLPTDESFGLALAEAMATGLPTVATDIGGCREVVQDGVTGMLVPPGDAAALTSALAYLLDPHAGAARRAHFGAAGRQRVLHEFSLDQQVERLMELYSQL